MSRTKLAHQETPADKRRVGIIDIGSNSIRLVVYDGPVRAPTMLFNEKVMAGLGRSLAQNGSLDEEAMIRGERAIQRFRILAEKMRVTQLFAVATAAVRDATNGQAFLDRICTDDFHVEIMSGDEEARMAGYGVLSGIPDANGIVGDLGGGSLELVRVANGKVHERSSFPLGVLRINDAGDVDPARLEALIATHLAKTHWAKIGKNVPFYLVGGSWRSVARLSMHVRNYPLRIVSHYQMDVEEPYKMLQVLAGMDKRRLRDVAGLSSSRIPTLPVASALLGALVKHLGSSHIVASAFGLRDGVVYRALSETERARDPLICGAREEGRLLGRFPEHGDELARWSASLFDDPPEMARLRHAACLLADTSWRAHPEFHAERGLETALHGGWAGIDAEGRAILARTLFTAFGGKGPVALLDDLCSPEKLLRADQWGSAIRLSQRLSGGVSDALAQTSIRQEDGKLILTLGPDGQMLDGEVVDRRLRSLAALLGLEACVNNKTGPRLIV